MPNVVRELERDEEEEELIVRLGLDAAGEITYSNLIVDSIWGFLGKSLK